MAAVSLLTCDRLIEVNSPAGLTRRAVVPIAAILVLFFPGYDFGQREHWALLLTLPYVVARSRRITGTTISNTAGFAIGFAACLGFCFKPYFLLVPISLEIWLLARTRRAFVWVSPETIAMVVTGFVYFGLIVIYVPTYLKHDVPSVLLAYWTVQDPLPEVMFWAIKWLALTGLLALLGYVTHPEGERTSALAQAFAVAGAAYLVNALAQMGTASYRFLPSAVFFALCALALLMAGMPRRLGIIAVLIAAGFFPSAVEAVRTFAGGGPTALIEQLAAVFRANPGPNRTVSGFITAPTDVLPAIIASEMKWAGPTCCVYLIAAAVRVDEASPADRPAIRAASLDQAEIAIAAMRTEKPGVIVIDANDDMLGFRNHRKFNYLEWLDAHTDFASVLADYREINPIAHYRIFVRK
jgi:hypothetical protein